MRTGSYAHGEMDINFSVKKGIRFWEPIQNIGTTNAQFLGVLANTWFPWLRRLHNEEDVSCNLSRHFLATYLSERADTLCNKLFSCNESVWQHILQ